MNVKRAAIGTLLAISVVLVAPAAAFPGQKAAKPKLPDIFKKWLDEDVAYIIAPMEREVFLQLQSDRERDLFIEAFWKQRDPTPASEENEFKTEHFRLGVVGLGLPLEPLGVPRLAQDDVEAAAVGPPAGASRGTPKGSRGSPRPTTPRSGSTRAWPRRGCPRPSTSSSSGRAATANTSSTARSATAPRPS